MKMQQLTFENTHNYSVFTNYMIECYNKCVEENRDYNILLPVFEQCFLISTDNIPIPMKPLKNILGITVKPKINMTNEQSVAVCVWLNKMCETLNTNQQALPRKFQLDITGAKCKNVKIRE